MSSVMNLKENPRISPLPRYGSAKWVGDYEMLGGLRIGIDAGDIATL